VGQEVLQAVERLCRRRLEVDSNILQPLLPIVDVCQRLLWGGMLACGPCCAGGQESVELLDEVQTGVEDVVEFGEEAVEGLGDVVGIWNRPPKMILDCIRETRGNHHPPSRCERLGDVVLGGAAGGEGSRRCALGRTRIRCGRDDAALHGGVDEVILPLCVIRGVCEFVLYDVFIRLVNMGLLSRRHVDVSECCVLGLVNVDGSWLILATSVHNTRWVYWKVLYYI
jgi:hypothetical protein